jgi:fibronectin type 3 domain-containing protein
LVRLAALAAAVATALVVALPASSAGAGGSFFVGFTDDLVKSAGPAAVGPAAGLGAKAFRVTLMWEPGQTTLDPGAIASLNTAVSSMGGMRLVLAVYADMGLKAPLDGTARGAYCSYVKSALTRYSSIRDVVIWNEPNKRLFWNPQTNAPALYEELVAQCWDLLHKSFANVNVIGLALSSTGNDDSVSTSPGAFIRGVGDAYRSSGRTKRLMDTVGFHPYAAAANERPWRKHIQSKTIGEGDWNKLAYNLWLAFNGTAQPAPGAIWYLEAGFQTAIAPGKEAWYTGTENVATIPDWVGGEPDAPPPADTISAPDQGTQVLDAIRLAYCQQNVGAYFNFLLADEPRLSGWQSGAYWADLTPKGSLPAFQSAIAAVNSKTVDCSGLKGGLPSPDFMPPPAPTGLAGQVAVSPLSVALHWDGVSDPSAPVSYRVYRNNALLATISSTDWTDPSPVAGQAYAYAVRAIDAASNLGDAATLAVTVDVSPPAAPASLSAQWFGSPSHVELTWPAAADDLGVAAYEVSRDGTVIGTTTSTSFTDNAIAPATTYSYSVVAIDGGGNRSDPVSAPVTTPADTAPPSTPTGLTGKASSSPRRINLAWSPSTDDVGVTAYRVYRQGVVIATVGVTSYTDLAVAKSTKYGYAVTALDVVGNESPLSPTLKVTTK